MNRKNAQMKIRSFDFDVKAYDEKAATFSGYGSVFGVLDSYREVVAPGAFAQSLADLNAKGRSLPVLWQHRGAEPIGHWDMSSLKEDARGLYGSAELWIEEAPYARIAARGMKTRSITGLSIGYYVREDAFDQKERITTLKRLDLVEISLVTTPANDEARIDQIKAKLAHGSLPTTREFELFLREHGFSRNQATAIAERGLKNLVDCGDAGEGKAAAAIAAALGEFELFSTK